MLPMLYADILDEPQQLLHFEQIYYDHRKEMFTAAHRILKDRGEAEDAVQEALLGIARNMPTVSRITRPAELRLYVLRAARNAALNRLPAVNRRSTELELSAAESVPDSSVWDAMCRRSDRQALAAAFAAVPQPYRDALYDHFVLGFTAREVSRMLNISLSAARQRLVRGKKLLLESLEKEGLTHGTD